MSIKRLLRMVIPSANNNAGFNRTLCIGAVCAGLAGILLASPDARAATNSPSGVALDRSRFERAEPPKPTAHVPRMVEGWKVLVDDRLINPTNAVVLAQALDFLKSRLIDIKILVSQNAVMDLQKVTIVLDLSHGKLRPMQYHPDADWLAENGYSTNLAKCVHLPIAADLLTARNINQQPMVILHELTHAYHDQVLGFDEPRILRAYEAYKKSGNGDRALLYDGTRTRHYGLTDHKEFFAEMTESYFGMNDFFPFNRAELMTAEPEIFELMETIWGPVAGVPPKRTKEAEKKRATLDSGTRQALLKAETDAVANARHFFAN